MQLLSESVPSEDQGSTLEQHESDLRESRLAGVHSPWIMTFMVERQACTADSVAGRTEDQERPQRETTSVSNDIAGTLSQGA